MDSYRIKKIRSVTGKQTINVQENFHYLKKLILHYYLHI